MRLVFLGTPEVAATALRRLHAAGHDVALVVTNPDRRRGRGGAVSPSPVKAAANDLGLSVSHDVNDAVGVGADLGVVVAFGQIIRPEVLDLLPLVNLHFSLLPRWRGAAPVERAVLEGDDVTGVCVMRIEEGLDTGPVFARAEMRIDDTVGVVELRDRLVEVGCDLLIELLERPVAEWIEHGEPQEGEATIARKITTADRRIDWSEPSDVTMRRIRLGGAWTTFRDRRLLVHSAAVVGGDVVPLVVQPEGKAAMPFAAWRNGADPQPGELFASIDRRSR
jgi:methionyl-tRNA formyltransferase